MTDYLETLAHENPVDETMHSDASPRVRMADPKSISPSLFDADVNTVATEEEEQSLKTSIAAKGIQIPLTAGRIAGKGKYSVVKGSRRHRFALELGLKEIPVEYKEYSSLDEMKQDALEDNLERRQYSAAALAKQAYTLWLASESPEARKELVGRGVTPRKHAATSSGISETNLAYFRSVRDSGDADLIAKMESGTLSIGAAYNQMKKQLTEGASLGEKKDRAVQSQRFLEILGEYVKVLKKTPDVIAKAEAMRGALEKMNKSELQRITKKLNAAARVVAELDADNSLSRLYTALTMEWEKEHDQSQEG